MLYLVNHKNICWYSKMRILWEDIKLKYSLSLLALFGIIGGEHVRISVTFVRLPSVTWKQLPICPDHLQLVFLLNDNHSVAMLNIHCPEPLHIISLTGLENLNKTRWKCGLDLLSLSPQWWFCCRYGCHCSRQTSCSHMQRGLRDLLMQQSLSLPVSELFF